MNWVVTVPKKVKWETYEQEIATVASVARMF